MSKCYEKMADLTTYKDLKMNLEMTNILYETILSERDCLYDKKCKLTNELMDIEKKLNYINSEYDKVHLKINRLNMNLYEYDTKRWNVKFEKGEINIYNDFLEKSYILQKTEDVHQQIKSFYKILNGDNVFSNEYELDKYWLVKFGKGIAIKCADTTDKLQMIDGDVFRNILDSIIAEFEKPRYKIVLNPYYEFRIVEI